MQPIPETEIQAHLGFICFLKKDMVKVKINIEWANDKLSHD